VSSVSTALSSNIPTGLLVDCCCESVQQFFSGSYFWWLQFIKLSGYTAVQQNVHREREGAAAATRGVVPQWRRAWGRVEALQAGGCRVGEGLTF